jgi:2-polyprenyl-3-methyl-5-hydroxy-6-metoxy-1,4-benzoquinol methylase
LAADWKEPAQPSPKSNARWGFAGLYGWQRECDPTKRDYNQTYWDVHKSGYSGNRLQALLEEAGYAKVEVSTVESCHLVARAVKLTQKNERQVCPRVEGIRPDHVARYKLALNYVPLGGRIADAACGVGYGSYILAGNHKANCVHAFDIDSGAIEYARLHYNHQKIIYHQTDLARSPFSEHAFDLLISFETIEHLKDPEAFLGLVHQALDSRGIFICSTPNEDTLPLVQMGNKYHHRHYTPVEFEGVLKHAGFCVMEKFTQTDSQSEQIQRGWHGLYNIAVCRKT